MSRQPSATLSRSPHSTLEPLSDALSAPSVKGSNCSSKPTRSQRVARPLQFPRDRLALTFRRCREQSGLSFSQLADRSGVDVAHIWRIEQGEHQNVSREVLILLSIAMVLGSESVDLIVDVANLILDSAGLKMLRTPQDSSNGFRSAHPRPGKNGNDSWR
ncbi:MAG TPA: helix-turn-helix transcriptional regulator [Anaerolineae bacterium]|nr:helix-turn-helix transcriptional regulator [Anaerolineae bacterium]